MTIFDYYLPSWTMWGQRKTSITLSITVRPLPPRSLVCSAKEGSGRGSSHWRHQRSRHELIHWCSPRTFLSVEEVSGEARGGAAKSHPPSYFKIFMFTLIYEFPPVVWYCILFPVLLGKECSCPWFRTIYPCQVEHQWNPSSDTSTGVCWYKLKNHL